MNAALAMNAVPHRHPMRHLDRLDAVEPGTYGRGIKQVSVNDVLTNTLVVDALGQVAIAVMAPTDGAKGEVWYLATIENVEFGEPARPGDELVMEAKILRVWRTTVRIGIHAQVGERTVARGVMVLATGEQN